MRTMCTNIPDFIAAVDKMPLAVAQKDIIKLRYVGLLNDAMSEQLQFHIMFVLLNFIISVSTVAATALIAVGKIPNVSENIVFWFTLGFSAANTLATKLMDAFGVTKKYLFGEVYVEKLSSEGWAFVAGTGRYKDAADMDAQFALFCERIEQLHLKSLEIMSDNSSTVQDMIAAAPNISNADHNDHDTHTNHTIINIADPDEDEKKAHQK